jgi:hypothetical protein
MAWAENKTDLAIKLAFGGDLALSGITKLVPSLESLLPLTSDHLMQTLALLALAVGITHATDALSAFLDRTKGGVRKRSDSEES